MTNCSLEGCESKREGLGYCGKHYQRVKKYGDPHAVKLILNNPDARFRNFYSVDASGCWLWTGLVERNGYGRFTAQGRRWGAHRWSYHRHIGPIPEGMTIDHLCRVKQCVNPQHLEAVTQAVNNSRVPTIPATINAAKTHCKRGHEFTPENTVPNSNKGPNRGRLCRTCHNAQAREQSARKRALART